MCTMRYTRKPLPNPQTVRAQRILGLSAVIAVCFFGYLGIHRRAPVATAPVTALAEAQQAASSQGCPAKLGTTRRVGIQAGHWKIDQLPNELSSLQWDFGASAAGINEVDVNLDIAQRVAALLQKSGIATDVIPATVPTDYCANAFVAIHADGNDVSSVYGYKAAPSSWDTDGKAEALSNTIVQDYGQVTNMHQNPTITDNMTQYYAFNYQKFNAAIDPNTPGVLIEAGFITNPTDRSMLVNQSQLLATGIANGILDYLNGKIAPSPSPTFIDAP